jgi:hypothetical protein
MRSAVAASPLLAALPASALELTPLLGALARRLRGRG